MKYAPRLLPVGLLSLTALVACTDQLEAPTAALRSAQPISAQGPLRDTEIDRTDTHFGARVVTTTERNDGEALLSAGDPLLTASEDEVYIEGGYGRDGRIRFSVYFESAAESPRVGSTRLVGNDAYMYDRNGGLISMQSLDQAMASMGLPSGDFSQAYFSSTPPTCPPEAAECAIYSESVLADATAPDDDVRVVRVRPLASQPAGGPTDVQLEQRFRRVRRATGDEPEVWRLEDMRRTERASAPRGARVTSTVTRVHYRSWDRHEGKERARAAARAAREAATPQRRTDRSLSGARANAAESAGAEASLIARSTPSADPASLSNLCAKGTAEFDRYRLEVTRGYDVVYQHGFCSDASVAFSFDERLAREVAIQRGRAFSLESTARIETQVADLRSRIASKRATPHLLIGHSQGGLVARRLGQLHPEYVGGVITIGTPHLGSYLAEYGPEAAAEALVDKADRVCFGAILCDFLADIMAEESRNSVLFGGSDLAPSLQDLRPNSPFLQTLNSTYETFPRVSIDVNIRSRWALARMVGDSRSPQERLLTDKRPRGDDRVTEVEHFYAWTMTLNRVALFTIFTPYLFSQGIDCQQSGYRSFWPGCNNPIDPQNRPLWYSTLLAFILYEATSAIMDAMNGVDRTWNLLTTKGIDEGDGLIHLASQRYPKTPGTYPPHRVSVKYESADSHSGELKSPGVITATRTAISLLGTN